MGLDMYLNKMPRYRGATAKDVYAVESYLDYMEEKEKDSPYAKGTFEEWCGLEKFPSQRYIDFYSKYQTTSEYGFKHIMTEVGYWRKANQIHKWFVENVQDGIDDCDYHREVTEDDLEELLSICQTVLESCELVPSQIENGYSFDENGNKVYNYVDGLAVQDSSVAEKLLPTEGGFFFGGTSYDEWYVDDIKNTIKIITNVLESTDFEKEMIYYRASW